MPPVVFESTIPAGERPQTTALDRAATGTAPTFNYNTEIFTEGVGGGGDWEKLLKPWHMAISAQFVIRTGSFRNTSH